MKPEVINNEDLYFDHKHWKSELDFWEQEMSYFRKQLEPIALATGEKEILARIDHFENQFKIHNSILEEIRDAIETHDQDLAVHARAHVDSIDRVRYKKHLEFRERMARERSVFQELKKEYYEFLAPLLARAFDV